MSREKNQYGAKRWLATARDDFKAAELLMKNKMFAHSCFLFRQSAEKALKAFWYLEGLDPWGHSILRLIKEFPQKRPFLSKLKYAAAFLDKFYIPTRYPNSLPELIPSQIYTQREAHSSRKEALKILESLKGAIPY